VLSERIEKNISFVVQATNRLATLIESCGTAQEPAGVLWGNKDGKGKRGGLNHCEGKKPWIPEVLVRRGVMGLSMGETEDGEESLQGFQSALCGGEKRLIG